MRFNSSKIIPVLGALGCFVTGAANATYGNCSVGGSCDSWTDSHVYNLVADANNGAPGLNIDVDGVSVNVSVSAWSDTGSYNGTGQYCFFGCIDKEGSNYWDDGDTNVKGANFAGPWGGGYGIQNADAGDSHWIDNLSSDYGDTDYDMVLLTFSHEVTLTGATFSDVRNGAASTQVSVAGLDVNGNNMVRGGNSSWEQIANSVSGSMKNSFQVGHSGAYYSDFTFTGASQYWLVGAYNAAFGFVDNWNNDGFKLASIGFSKPGDPQDTPDPVNAPGSFALLLLAGGFAAWRRKQSK